MENKWDEIKEGLGKLGLDKIEIGNLINLMSTHNTVTICKVCDYIKEECETEE
jgi:hypothetical protein